jgi:PAS domain S-box-containing protein
MSSNDPPRRDPRVGVSTGAAAPVERRTHAVERRARDRQVGAVVEKMSDAFLALDPEWRVIYANREAARLNGTTAAALVGRDHWETWPETRGSEVETQYRRSVAEQQPVSFEHYYPGADVWHDVRAYPSEDGGLAVFYRDITARKRMEAERARQARALSDAHDRALAAETRFRLLFERVLEYAVLLLDPDGIITHWGPGAARIKKWTAEEAVGMHLRMLYPGRGAAEDGSAEDHLRHAALHGEYIGEGTRVRRGTEPFQARVVLTALREGGRLLGYSKITQDLTGERERAAVLEHAMAAAEAASTAKSQFLANTSHEIRR